MNDNTDKIAEWLNKNTPTKTSTTTKQVEITDPLLIPIAERLLSIEKKIKAGGDKSQLAIDLLEIKMDLAKVTSAKLKPQKVYWFSLTLSFDVLELVG